MHLVLCGRPEELSADATLQWKITQKIGLPVLICTDGNGLSDSFTKAEWIVDAVFGTGFTRPVRPPFDRVIEAVNTSPARKFAVDIPSGLGCDTGEPMGPTIRAEHTVTFVAPKVGFAKPAATAFTGRVHVVDIGIVPAS